MTKGTSPFKRALKAAKQAMAEQRYGTHDKPFLCPFCGNDRFKLVSNASIFLGMHTYACTDCGHVEWFAKKLEPLQS